MTYNPSSLFSRSSYDQYGRSRGASKPTTSKPKSTGLGSSLRPRARPSTNTQTKSTWESLKERISNLIGASGGDNKPKSEPVVKAIKVYEKPEFKIPKQPDVTTSTLNTGRNTGGPSVYIPNTDNFGVNTGQMSAPEKPETAKFDITDLLGLKKKVSGRYTPPRGLMSPPNQGTTPSTSTGSVYKIKSGDTLSEIALKYNTSVERLARDNNIKDINKIRAGKTLKVPLFGESEDPDSQFYQSGVPMDQRDFAPEGPPFVPPEMRPPENAPGNNIDFDFIADQEGRAINNGYVPTRRDGTVVGQSGVTVGTGVDLGSKNDAYFDGLDESIKAKIRPHFGKKRTAAQTSLQNKPLTLTDSEVATLDRFVKEKELDTLRDKWNEDSDTDFDDLPTNQATAVASTYYQYGQQMFDHNYWDQTTSGDWEAARDNLRNYGDNYNSRRNREATYLESGEM